MPCSLIGFPSCFYSCRSHGSCICLLAPTQSLVQSTDKHETSRPTADLVSHTGSGAAGGVLDDEPALDLLLLSLPPSRLVSEAFQSRLFMVVITCALIDKVEKQHWFGVRVADLKCTATVMTTQFCTDNFSFTTRPLPSNRPLSHTLTHTCTENRKITEQTLHALKHTYMHVSYGMTCYTASTTILNRNSAYSFINIMTLLC